MGDGTPLPAPPAWVRELAMALPIYPQILLVGNVRDEYYLPAPLNPDDAPTAGNVAPLAIHRLTGVVRGLLAERDYAALALHDIVTDSLTLTPLRDDVTPPAALTKKRGNTPGVDFPRLTDMLTALTDNLTQPPTALLIEHAGGLTTPAETQPEAARLFFTAAEALAIRARIPIAHGREQPYNTVLWVADRVEDLPASFAVSNPRLRVITVPPPSPDVRRRAAERAVRIITARTAAATTQSEVDDAAARLAAATHGMQALQVAAVGQLAADQGVALSRVDDAARMYRTGVTDNPWRDPEVLHRISDGEAHLNRRVRGQTTAVRKTMDIFMRSATGLTGAHSSSSPSRPRGVLFLAGPTGVGKTELAKGIAELILGTDAQPIRFDMSEFASDHARDRLIGAPPGYVGFDAGGELTNAVRANPISVLLFDEIDKANPHLFDLFLQILEDGRLTDGRGSVVHFTECVLVFTSNLGIVGPHGRLTREDPPHQVREALRRAFDDFFDVTIGRPELLNRFGDSFVALDFITGEVAGEILEGMLDNVASRVWRAFGTHLDVAAPARDTLRKAAFEQLDHGGRGVGTAVETLLTNPLARHVFTHPPQPGQKLTVTTITADPLGWNLTVERQ